LGLNDILDLPIIFTMYGIYVVGSVVSIVRFAKSVDSK
jgi:hypothetical protein